MKISTRGRYGSMAMLDLALHYGRGPVLVKDISRRQNISGRYLENLLIVLKAAGMVRSSRGAHGGFTLARPPSGIRLSEIICAMEGPVALVGCVAAPDAYPRVRFCAVHDVWYEVGRAVNNVLESITLQELAERQVEKQEACCFSDSDQMFVS